MQDFNKLAASKKIEDKLKAVRDPVCPSGVITALINDDTITWDSTAGQKLINVIVSHSHTYINNLISIFSVIINASLKYDKDSSYLPCI